MTVLALGSNRDVPDEPQQFAPDRSHCLILVLPAGCEFYVTLVQSMLSFPGDLFDLFAQVQIALSSEQVTADPGSPLVCPCRIDDRLCVNASCLFW